jgi:PAS domain S-box-containing protein
MLGTPVARICPESLYNEQMQMLQFVRENGCIGPVETERLTADGRLVSVEMTITLRRGENRAPAGFVGIIRDITERSGGAQIKILSDRQS